MQVQVDRDHYYEQGYLIVKHLFSQEEVQKFRSGIQKIIDQAKSGHGKDIPWVNKEKGIPERLGHLLSPDFLQPEIASFYEESPIIEIIEYLLDGPIRFSAGGGGGMLASGDGKGYNLAWHRDKVIVEGEDQMLPLLVDALKLCQINAPLFKDRYLKIVPGSHIRTTTPEEVHILQHKPNDLMPGEVTVELEAGDVVFYNPNLLHTGYNPEGHFRWTLHCAFWKADAPLWSFEQRQGDLEWLRQPGQLSKYGPKVRSLFQRYIEAAAPVS